MQLTMTDSRVLEYFRILHRYMALLGDHPREEQSVPPRYIVSHPRQRNVIVDGREVHARWKGGLFEHAMFLSYLAGMAPSDALREQIDYAGTDQESVRRTVEFWLDQVSALGDHAIEESMMMEFDATVILHAALQSGPAPASP